MKNIFFIVLLFGSIAKAQTPVAHQKIGQSSYVYTNNAWEGVDSAIWQYSSAGFMSETNSLTYSSNAWQNIQRNVYHYTPTNKVDTQYRQSWNGSAWTNGTIFTNSYTSFDSVLESVRFTAGMQPVAKKINTYDSLKHLQTQTLQTYASGAWTNLSLNTYVYDANSGLIDNITYQNWDANNGWVNNYKRNYGFTANGFLSYYSQVNWQNGMYNYSQRVINIYDSSNNNIQTLVYKDSGLYYDNETINTFTNNLLTQSDYYNSLDTSNNWLPVNTATFLYNANKAKTNFTRKVYSSGVLQNDTMVNYVYNTQNLLSQEQCQKGYGTTWTNSQQNTYTYDADSNNIYKLIETFTNNAFVPSQKYYYYYANSVTALPATTINSLLVNIYPNPTKANATMACTTNYAEMASVQIVTVTGKTILAIEQPLVAGTNSIDLPISHLPTGMYVVVMCTPSFTFTKKLIKE